MTESGSPARRGRPRRAEIEIDVAQAVWSLLDEIGYEGLTIDAVAERAGCSRPTLYRRWDNKRAMVLDVLDRFMDATAQARPVVSGEGIEALFGWLRGIIDTLSGSGRGALLALSHARRRDEGLARALDRIMAEDRPKFLAELRPLIGPAASDDELNQLIDILMGTVFFRGALLDRPMSDAELRTLIEQQVAASANPIRYICPPVRPIDRDRRPPASAPIGRQASEPSIPLE